MSQVSEKFVRLSHLHKLRRCEQVAAVCYRVGGRGLEFLLVQTRGGRWTFPKGGTEPGLTHAQAAALEAFEEAGVHGRIEEASFARYIRREGNADSATGEKELAVYAHLCEVLRLDPPPEFGRTPTWFSATTAKRRLREGRKTAYATEISRVVDRAVERIERQRSATLARPQFQGTQKDALQKVQFEAGTAARGRMETAFVRCIRRATKQVEPPENGPRILRGAKVLQLNAKPD